VVTNIQLSGPNYALTLSVDSDIEYSVINGETADVLYLVLEDVYDTASASIIRNGGNMAYGTSPDASLTYTTPGGTTTTIDNEGNDGSGGESFATGYAGGAISGTDLIITFTHSAALAYQVGGTLKLSRGGYSFQYNSEDEAIPSIDNQPVTSFFAKISDGERFAIQSTNSSVPEPSTAIAMGLLGVLGCAGNRRRRRQVSAA